MGNNIIGLDTTLQLKKYIISPRFCQYTTLFVPYSNYYNFYFPAKSLHVRHFLNNLNILNQKWSIM
jgi:hypothetical protein